MYDNEEKKWKFQGYTFTMFYFSDIFLGTFLQHPCIQQVHAHTLKIYMKNTQNIYTGLTKYILTQFQSIELQILYKCLYNNPGMS